MGITNNAQALGEASRQSSGDLAFSRDLILQVLTDANCFGAVITGPTGSGRRVLLNESLRSHDETLRIVRLSGNNFGPRPMGVLSFLLAQLDVTENATSHEVVHGLSRLLFVENRAAIVVLGNPDLIDQQSSSILAQLAVMKKIKLFVVCEHTHELPQDLITIFASGRMKHLQLHGMNYACTESFLESHLGGQVSNYCAATLCYLTSGNRKLLRSLIRCWQDDGRLVEDQGIWTLSNRSNGFSASMNELHDTILSTVGPVEKDLLAALAIGGPASIEFLHQSELVAHLDVLLQKGMVSYAAEDPSKVRVATPLLNLLVRWNLTDQPNPRIARLLGKLHTDPAGAQTLALMKSLSDEGDYRAELEVAARFRPQGYEPAGWEADPNCRSEILEAHIKTLVMLSLSEEAMDVLQQVRPGLEMAIEHCSWPEPLERSLQRLEILYSYVLLFRDEHSSGRSAVNTEDELSDVSGWMSEELRLQALSLQAAGWAANTRQSDAIVLADYIDEQLQIVSLNARISGRGEIVDATEIELQQLFVELLSGHWRRASSRAERILVGHHASPLQRGYANLVRGVLCALADEPDLAMSILEPCVVQLRVFSPSPVLSAAESVLAFLLSDLGRQGEAEKMLGNVLEPIDTSSLTLNFFTWTRTVFTSVAMVGLGRPKDARKVLREYGDKLRREGHSILYALTLAYALRAGETDLVADLEVASRRCRGVLGQYLNDLANAQLGGNSVDVVDALIAIAREGNLLLALSTNNSMTATLKTHQQRKLNQALNRMKRSMFTENESPNNEQVAAAVNGPNWVQELTKREAQIATLAISGKSNHEIAKFSGVSIRTVEGHLYQVYSKLQVRNRQELTALDRTSRRASAIR